MNTANYNNKIFKQLEEVMSKCDSLTSEIKTIKKEHKIEIEKLKYEHKNEINNLKKQHNMEIQNLNNKINVLEKENKTLRDENDKLKNIINKDSNNSSLPPSTNNNKKKIVNLREKSSKKIGAQKGHKGSTFKKEDIEEILKHDMVIQDILYMIMIHLYIILDLKIDMLNVMSIYEDT